MQEVEEFLLNAQRCHGQEGAVCNQSATIQDNEQVQQKDIQYCKIPSLFSRFSVHCVFIHVLQALYELVKCNFNAEEALRRLRFNVKVFRGKQTFPVVPFKHFLLSHFHNHV